MKTILEGTFVALGTFDGLHIGHKAVITSEKSEYQRKIALMFREHPQKQLTGVNPGILTTSKKEGELLAEWGVEAEYIDFPSISSLSPEEFVDEVLVKTYNARSIACGFNYRFGKRAEGNVSLLRRLCAEREIKLTVVDSINFMDEPVSSTRIRKAIAKGDMASANAMLGRCYSYDFEVMHGDERGRILGSPTINQFFMKDFCVPEFGVYASYTIIDGKKYPSVTNIGVRPTIEGVSEKRSETNIIGFQGDLYGKHPEVFIVEKIRGELKFATLDDLSEQIAKDRELSVKILKFRDKGED
jgi:riboflavin kinase/FMN adenylyltransferase